MARARIVVTQDWVQISSGAVIITVDVNSRGALYFNETPDFNTAIKVYPTPGEQFFQTDVLPTYVQADELGYELIVDGAL